ncbi:MAG: hypothetical protein IJH39_00120 [Clostridia bacterium]|nr:hypothetical protein [Clostridia bacterium]
MKTMKKIIGWVLFGIAFIIVSELVINVSLNSSYKDMSQKSSLPTGVSVYQAESTLVNGRIRGNVENTGNPNIEGKYLKVDIYSERNVKLGTDYIDLTNLKVGEKQPFEVFYKLQNSSYYDISIADEKEEVDSSLFFLKDAAKRKIIRWLIIAIIFKV